MTTSDFSFLDTDLQLFRLDPDPEIRKAANIEFESESQSAMSAFSLVELKGNYIANLILLRRKIEDSTSLGESFSRIRSTGTRKSMMMLAQLINWFGGEDFSINPWAEAQRLLLVLIDAQINNSWFEFQNNIKQIFDDFSCSRAAEGPEVKRGKWSATIPRCRPDNSNCTIVRFIRSFQKELERLLSYLSNLDPSEKTEELDRIENVIKKAIEKNAFPWQGYTCRRVGDLLIGLQSKSGRELVSSNRKEHGVLHGPLGYNFREFPVASIRLK